MKKEVNEAEKRLLKNTSIDELIKMKMEEELIYEIEQAKIQPEKNIITEISKVPTNMIFSKQSVFKVFNKKNKTETRINGVQAESMLGLQTSTREKLKMGQTDTFSTENLFVKFEKIVL